MNRLVSKLAKTLIAGIFLAGVSGVVLAQENDGSERKTKETVAMSQQVYEQLMEIQELMEAKDYAKAQVKIDDLRNQKRLSDYERAQIWNISAYSYYLQERLDDAIMAYDQVLAQPDLPEALQFSTLKTKAQLHFQQEQYEDALQVIRELMAAIPEPSADVLMIEGQALFQMQRYEEALVPIRTAINMYRDQGQTPKENWLLLLRVIYFEQKDYNSMIDVVKELIRYYPKDTYIRTLAGIYSELGDTKKQLALTEVLYDSGILSRAGDITNLANLYLLHGLPYKAAVVLEKEMNSNLVESNERNLRLLSQAWYQAREDQKAIPPLERAAEMTNEGDLYIRLAQAHINLENWGDAASAARKGIQAGGLRRPDQANIILGMALNIEKRLEQAKRPLEPAARHNRSKRTAKQSIANVDSEIKRRDLMSQEMPDYQPREKDDLLEAIEGEGEGN